MNRTTDGKVNVSHESRDQMLRRLGVGFALAGFVAVLFYVLQVIRFMSGGYIYSGFDVGYEPSVATQILTGGILTIGLALAVALSIAAAWTVLLVTGFANGAEFRDTALLSVVGGLCVATGVFIVSVVTARMGSGWVSQFPAEASELGLVIGFGCLVLATPLLAVTSRRPRAIRRRSSDRKVCIGSSDV
ncbi:MAG: hypothetical protein ACPHCI_08460 [Solirubrobacterales bacterium]